MHKAEVVQDDRIDQMPYLAKCSCGTEGHFRLEPLAYMWINRHLEGLGEDPIHPTEPITATATAPESESESKPADTSKTGGGRWEPRGGQRK